VDPVGRARGVSLRSSETAQSLRTQSAPGTIIYTTNNGGGYDNWQVTSVLTIAVRYTVAPTVQLNSVQYDGSRWLSAKVSASDSQSGAARVEIYVDSVLKAALTAAPWTFKINVKTWRRARTTASQDV
jgi:hypothetical protein